MSQRPAGSAFAGADTLLEPGTLDQLRLAWRLFRDPRVAPRLKTAVPVLAALYVISPVDLIPDFLLGLGQVDDLGIIGLALLMLTRVLPRLAPREVVAEHMADMGLGPRETDQGAARRPPDGPVMDAPYRIRDEESGGAGQRTR